MRKPSPFRLHQTIPAILNGSFRLVTQVFSCTRCGANSACPPDDGYIQRGSTLLCAECRAEDYADRKDVDAA